MFGADVKETQVLQRQMMAQMLMERSILEEETDRDSEAKTLAPSHATRNGQPWTKVGNHSFFAGNPSKKLPVHLIT